MQERKEIVSRIYAKGERKQISNGKEGRRSHKVLTEKKSVRKKSQPVRKTDCCDHELSSLNDLAQPATTVFKAIINL